MWYESILDTLQTLLSVLVGGAVVYYFGIRQLKAQQRLAFRERQLAELYAPLAGLRKQQYLAMQSKLDKAYDDRLGGRISDELWLRRSGEWRLSSLLSGARRHATNAPATITQPRGRRF